MTIAVIGLWHLGSVTAACLANAGYDVIGFDTNLETIKGLQNAEAPIFEPGLNEMIRKGQDTHKLQFSNDYRDLKSTNLIWITFDTPVDEQDKADVEFVKNEIIKALPHINTNSLIILSSQLPVGTTRQMQRICENNYPEKALNFACIPENLRLGKAIQVFTHPDRVIVGLQSENDKDRILKLLSPFTQQIIWMSLESAEMTKHALNAFLATSVVFINELATLCEKVGADAREVELGLKSEERIGPKAYLRPGNAIAGGTLARDVNYLIQLSSSEERSLFSSLLKCNDEHKLWSCRRLLSVLKDLKDKKIVSLGLTYKAGTDTLRRSTSVATCQWLNQQGAYIIAFDPVIKELTPELSQFINLKQSLEEALDDADAIILATEWPEFNAINPEKILAYEKNPAIFDPGGFLAKTLGEDKRLRYFTVGRN